MIGRRLHDWLDGRYRNGRCAEPGHLRAPPRWTGSVRPFYNGLILQPELIGERGFFAGDR